MLHLSQNEGVDSPPCLHQSGQQAVPFRHSSFYTSKVVKHYHHVVLEDLYKHSKSTTPRKARVVPIATLTSQD